MKIYPHHDVNVTSLIYVQTYARLLPCTLFPVLFTHIIRNLGFDTFDYRYIPNLISGKNQIYSNHVPQILG